MKKIIAFLVAAVMTVSMVGCSGPQQQANATDGLDTNAFYAVSLGWMENPSGQRQKQAFEAKFAEYGITNYSIVDANYDAKKQSEQIEAFIAQKPVALFLTPSDPVGIAEAVKKAADSGIKVYSSDGYVPGAEVAGTVMFDNFSGGQATMTYLADLLLEKYPEGDVVIGMITLPSNEGWDAREHGAKAVLAQEKYSRIKVEYEWPWDSTGAVTPTNTISSWIAADTNKELKAIWCAWDGAVFEGLTVTSEARPEILYTGSDGGEQCFETMVANPDQFVATIAESVWSMPNQLVDYAIASMEGNRIPRIVMAPGFLITTEMIQDVDAVKEENAQVGDKTLSAWELLLDYDLTGYTEALNTILEQNGKVTTWIPSV